LLRKSGLLLSCGILSPITSVYVRNQPCRAYSKPRNRPKRSKSRADEDEEEFNKLDIRGFNIESHSGHKLRPFQFTQFHEIEVKPPRKEKMSTDQDWTSVWPAAHTFKASVVPLPVRQGAVFGDHENKGLSPEAHANPELMKIPNFFHLTPQHIRNQCAAIKKFCTPWPEELQDRAACEQHFPITIKTKDYVFDGASIREPEARKVTLNINTSKLGLDKRSYDKLRKLVGDRLNHKTGRLTLATDRCPSKKQNLEYAMYLLTVLNFESKKTEQWESFIEVQDMTGYHWELMPSKKSMDATLEKIKELASNPDSNVEILTEEIPVKLESYAAAVTNLQEQGDSLERLDDYKNAVKKLLIG